MSSRFFFVVTSALALVPACSSASGGTTSASTTSTSSGSGGTSATGGTGGAPALPDCNVMSSADSAFSCGLPSPCAGVVYSDHSGAGAAPAGSTPHFDDMDAVTCVLEKLRDRDVSQVSYIGYTGPDNGAYYSSELIFIVDSEHAASNYTIAQDVSSLNGTKNRQILKPPAYFTGCLALTDPKRIYTCLTGWSAGCADVAVTCPELP